MCVSCLRSANEREVIRPTRPDDPPGALTLLLVALPLAVGIVPLTRELSSMRSTVPSSAS